MGQILSSLAMGDVIYRRDHIHSHAKSSISDRRSRRRLSACTKWHPKSRLTFVDLRLIPRELAFNILSNLNATDLCLAACVWDDLGSDDLLWQDLCHRTWPVCSAYQDGLPSGWTYRKLYLRMDEARLTFNANAHEGMEYLFKYGLLQDRDEDLVRFLTATKGLNPTEKRRFLHSRPALLRRFIEKKDFRNHLLANALRHLFNELPAPLTEPVAMEFVSLLVSAFSDRFVQCNPSMAFTKDEVYMLCFSLIMLSVDFWCPHVKNKMSKREFIRNTRHVTRVATDDFLGHLYDNVYMIGHVVLGHLKGSPFRKPAIRDALL